jgi:hypothetical protein
MKFYRRLSPYFRVLAHQQKTNQWNDKLAAKISLKKLKPAKAACRPYLVNIDYVNIEAEAEAEGVN